MAKHNEIGVIGEQLATKYLENKGFYILDRNYRKKWGELDIVAEKEGIIHIVEVKTVSKNSFGDKFKEEIDRYRPEDNMHPWKLQRLKRAIQTYLLEKYKKTEPSWQFDLICVFLDQTKRVAKIKLIENLIL